MTSKHCALLISTALVSSVAVTPAMALLSLNVTHDNALVPDYVVNRFTIDSDYDVHIGAALSDLSSGSMYNVTGWDGDTQSYGPGDSYYSINNDPSTSGGLSPGDINRSVTSAFFDESGIGVAWFNVSRNDIGMGLHMMTLTFSDDTYGSLQFIATTDIGWVDTSFDIIDGYADFTALNITERQPEEDPPTNPDPDPNPNPDPDPDPGTNPTWPNPGSGNNAIPEPVGLGVFGVIAAVLGGLHRRRLID